MGKQLRAKVKEALRISEAEAIGQAKGKVAALKKLSWSDQLQAFAAQLKEKMSLSDLMEGIAVIGATVIIKSGIDWTQTPIPKAVISGFSITQGFRVEPLLTELISWLRGQTTQAPPQATQEEILEWLMAFALAYVIVHNFGAIVSGASSILKVATTLLAAA